MNRKTIFPPTVLMIGIVVISSFLFPAAAGTFETANNLLTNDSGLRPGNIPDSVAFELFFRTVAEGNARGLVRRAGFDNDEDIERLMRAAYSLQEALELADQKAREIKENKERRSDTEIKSELFGLQEKKDEIVTREIIRYLPSNLGDKGMNNLRNFINTDVKPKTKSISIDNLQKANAVSFVKTSGNLLPKVAGGTGVLLYSTAWLEGMTVYGSGTVSESYDSGISYHVTTTVTSPGGRSNTTESDWSYAAVTNSTGLSIDVEDGTYTVQANFDQQAGGFYDEFGSFDGGGSSFVGNSTSSIVVAPSVSITAIDPSTDVELRPGEHKTFKVAVQATGGVVTGTQVFLEFNEVSNFGNVNYSVDDRSKVFSFGSSGGTINTSFIVSVDGSSSTGNVSNKGRIDHATAPGGADVTVGTRESTNMSFTVRNSPTTACSVECYEWNPMCPCYGQGGVFGENASICKQSPVFVKAGYSTKSKVPFCNCTSSPIVIDILGNGFAMTNAAGGVPFDFNGDGITSGRLGWTTSNSDDAWLVLDRNQNNLIDSGKELFGNATQQPAPPEGAERQGFLALAEYDKTENFGNGDGKITRRDRVFKKLKLWQDRNHNGVSEAEELFRLPALDVVAIFLNYQESRRTDEFGNRFKYRARVRDRLGANVGRWAWDVFVVTAR